MAGAAVVSGAASGAALEYDWRQLRIGGTGWVTGLVSHPSQADVRWARTDTGGFYRWDAAADAWAPALTASAFPNLSGYQSETGVESVAVAASDPGVVYAALKDRVYRSTDGGGRFTPTSLTTPMDANGAFRSVGERLAVDPRDPDAALFGSREQGLFRTTDGTSWSALPASSVPWGAPGVGITTVTYDPGSAAVAGRTSVAYAATDGAGIFRTADGGATWAPITGGAGAPGDARRANDLKVASDGSLYVAYSNAGSNTGGVWRYRPDAPGGGAWSSIVANSGQGYVTVAPDPFDPQRVIYGTGGLQSLRLSTDGGATSRALTWERSAPDIPWAELTDEGYFSTDEVYYDPVQPDLLRVAQGIGVWDADASPAALADNRVTWRFDSAGIEQLVTQDVIAPRAGRPVTAGWDRTGFVHTDPDQYNATQIFPGDFSVGWDLASQPGNPDYLVVNSASTRSFEGYANYAGYSDDGGQTWRRFGSVADGTHPVDLKYGNLAVSAAGGGFDDHLVWVPAEFDENGGSQSVPQPWYSDDGGQTWQKSPGWVAFGNGQPISTGAFIRYFNHQGLVADEVTPGTFYVVVKNIGVVRSTDGGVNWQFGGSGLPALAHHAQLRAAPGHAGHLWYAPGAEKTEGLYFSDDGGVSFTAIPGTANTLTLALGAAAPGSDYPTVYFVGDVHGVTGIHRSTDRGLTWDFLGQYPLELRAEPKQLAADPDLFGRIYLGLSGTGFVYGDLAAALRGDYNGNGLVEQGDLNLVLSNWGRDGAAPPTGWVHDFPDGLIDQGELNAVLDRWGDTTAPDRTALPEPAAGLVWLLATRRPGRHRGPRVTGASARSGNGPEGPGGRHGTGRKNAKAVVHCDHNRERWRWA